jgi:hypothetical protein
MSACGRLLREDERIRPNDWKHQTEQLDQLVTFRQALRLVGKEPQRLLAFFATKKLELPSGEPREREITRTVRAMQHAFVDRFGQGRLITSNGPRYMERAFPEAIAAETKRSSLLAAKALPRRRLRGRELPSPRGGTRYPAGWGRLSIESRAEALAAAGLRAGLEGPAQ